MCIEQKTDFRLRGADTAEDYSALAESMRTGSSLEEEMEIGRLMSRQDSPVVVE
jgi:uncharacterized protein YceH (UPF0502 family)